MIIPLRRALFLSFGLVLTFNSFGFDGIQPFKTVALDDGCTDESACNFNPWATTDDGSCEFLSCLIGCMDTAACNFNADALYPNNGACDYTICAGCTDSDACNFDSEATIANPSVCVYSCFGCSDFTACNFDPEAEIINFSNCIYADPYYDCAGNSTGCFGCEPVFNLALSDEAAECADQLPLIAPETAVAFGGCSADTLSHGVFTADMRNSVLINAGFTGDGAGTDGAIRILGLTALGLSDSDYFVETYPLILTRFVNGFATLSGEVRNAENPNLKWSVHLTFEDAQPANLWLNSNESNGLVSTYGCPMDPEDVIVYRLKADQSFLIGKGGYLNSYLQLSHMPFNENKRFQLGVGANSSTCAYGMGGWFAWEGTVLGLPVTGMTGDVVIDLSSDGINEVSCGSESTAHFYSALNPSCGLLTDTVQFFSRLDLEPPTWAGNCPAEINLCSTGADLPPSIPLPCESLFFDSCEEPLSFSFSESFLEGDSLDGNGFVLQRVHSAEDCSGNVGTFIQTISFDGVVCPELLNPTTQPSDLIAEENRSEDRFSPVSILAKSAKPFNLKIHPNPTNGTSQLQWKNPDLKPVTIQVYHPNGSAALPEIQWRAETNSLQRLNLNRGSLPSGVYFIQIRSNKSDEVILWMLAD
jgi:hypothetical protein